MMVVQFQFPNDDGWQYADEAGADADAGVANLKSLIMLHLFVTRLSWYFRAVGYADFDSSAE